MDREDPNANAEGTPPLQRRRWPLGIAVPAAAMVALTAALFAWFAWSSNTASDKAVFDMSEFYLQELSTQTVGHFQTSIKGQVAQLETIVDTLDDESTASEAALQEAVADAANRCGMPYVNARWLGGMLTNFKTIQSRIARLKAIETMEQDGTFEVLPKKEVIELKKELAKLQKNLGGIKEMKRLPDAIFVVDPKKERICVQEAHTLGIPLIGICDTNCDPEELDYVIPGNDDAIRAVKLIVSKMADAVIEAKQGEAEEAAYEEAAEADAE